MVEIGMYQPPIDAIQIPDIKREKREIPRETEVKLGVLRRDVANVLEGQDVRQQIITQEYLDSKQWTKILEILRAGNINKNYLEDIDELVSTMGKTPENLRVRRTFEDGEETFFFTVKGDKNTDDSREIGRA